MTVLRPYNVRLLPGLREQLESQLTVVDACGAMTQLFSILPYLHDRRPRSSARIDDGDPPVYVGRFGWVDIGFSYVELVDTLVIVRFWKDLLWGSRAHEVDCVLDNRAVGFLLTYREGGL